MHRARVPEIWETDEDQLLTLNKLHEKYIQYARQQFIKTPPLVIKNQQTGWSVEITTRVFKEWRQKSRTRSRIIAIQLLDKMLETAVLIKTGGDSKKTRGIESVSEFENRCGIGGVPYKIRIVVKSQSGRRFMYYFGAVAIK